MLDKKRQRYLIVLATFRPYISAQKHHCKEDSKRRFRVYWLRYRVSVCILQISPFSSSFSRWETRRVKREHVSPNRIILVLRGMLGVLNRLFQADKRRKVAELISCALFDRIFMHTPSIINLLYPDIELDRLLNAEMPRVESDRCIKLECVLQIGNCGEQRTPSIGLSQDHPLSQARSNLDALLNRATQNRSS